MSPSSRAVVAGPEAWAGRSLEREGAASVYLVGFMGAGKTTAGRLLARELRRPFLDLDVVVEERAGGRTVAEIFEAEGERGFREREWAVLEAVAGTRAVVATGGGILEDPRSRERMLASGLVLWLHVPLEVIWSRIGEGGGGVRPLWTDFGAVRRLYGRREGLYALAHRRHEAGGDPPDVVARDLARAVLEQEGSGG